MDDLQYNYYRQNGSVYNTATGSIPTDATNKLAFVTDNVASANYADDIDNQNPGNYDYDKIGNLIKDKSEEIDSIKWNNFGKVAEIKRKQGSHKPNLKFSYSPMGERIEKKVIFVNDTLHNYSDYYMRDAQGNIMAIYRKDTTNNNVQELRLQELPIYGSSRIGMYKPDIKIPFAIINNGSGTPIEVTHGVTMHNTNLYSGIIYQNSVAMTPINFTQHPAGAYYSVTRGFKQYELSNHLQSVVSTISDRKIPHETSTGVIEFYSADIVSGCDMYPFGMEMPGRKFSSNTYKFGYQGSEKDDEIAGVTQANFTTFYREGDTRKGQWDTPDPILNPSESPYVMMGDNPIWKNDPLGNLDDNYTINKNGTVDKEITADKTDNYKYKDDKGNITDLGTYNKLDNGLIQIPKNGDVFINNSDQVVPGKDRNYVDPNIFAGMLGAAFEYKNESGLTMQINQLNDENGKHSGAPVKGGCADIRYANLKGDVNESVWTSGSNYDSKNSQLLVNKFTKFGFNKPLGQSILTENAKGDGPALLNTRFVDGSKNIPPYHHKHHIHLQRYNFTNIIVK